MSFLLALLANKYTRAVMEILGILALVGFCLWRIYAAGKSAGSEQQAAHQVDADKRQFESELAAYRGELDAAAKREATLAALFAQERSAAAAAARASASAEQARQEDQATVASLPVSAVRADLEKRLGGSLADPLILRKDDAMVADDVAVQGEMKQMHAQIDSLGQAENTVSGQANEARKERDAAMAAYNQVLPLYARAFNALPRKRGFWGNVCGVVTLYRACRPAHLALPDPVTLPKSP